MYGTGVGVARRGNPHWWLATIQATAVTIGRRPARVAELHAQTWMPNFYANYPREEGQWLVPPGHFPPVCRMTFRTEFELTGFDPATAPIEGRFAVDDSHRNSRQWKEAAARHRSPVIGRSRRCGRFASTGASSPDEM